MRRSTHYEVSMGLWSPRDNDWSWVVCDDFLTRAEAAKFVDRQIAEHFDLVGEKVTAKHREEYRGPPYAVTKVMTSVEFIIKGTVPAFDDA